QATSTFQKLSIFIAEGIQSIALGIEHPKNVLVLVTHGHNDFGAGGVECGQIAPVLVDIPHNDGLAGLQRGAAESLCSWETCICRRLATRFCHNHELVLDNLVNA